MGFSSRKIGYPGPEGDDVSILFVIISHEDHFIFIKFDLVVSWNKLQHDVL